MRYFVGTAVSPDLTHLEVGASFWLTSHKVGLIFLASHTVGWPSFGWALLWLAFIIFAQVGEGEKGEEGEAQGFPDWGGQQVGVDTGDGHCSMTELTKMALH